jgi:hypothetical protein
MVSEQADLYDWFGRIASTLEWTVTYAGAPLLLAVCAVLAAYNAFEATAALFLPTARRAVTACTTVVLW